MLADARYQQIDIQWACKLSNKNEIDGPIFSLWHVTSIYIGIARRVHEILFLFELPMAG